MFIEMEEFDPGAAKHGNFITYYKFHSLKERVDLLPIHLLLSDSRDVTSFLDIGCNTGDLTEAVYKEISLYKNCYALALDLDNSLIERAIEKNHICNISYKCVNVAEESELINALNDHLELNNKRYFDIVFLFSVTMWIHLNYGDIGLMAFFQTISKYAKVLVVEPQPWKCYKSAVRRLKRAKKEPFMYFNSIKMRESVEEDLDLFLREACSFEKIYESPRTNWGRKISIYKQSRLL
ncbi:probable RNA methyltransferase CG11342 isoform X1 [Cimex lectularius]|uniref:RNA methyltransferase n=1 Tax=Cimex lectularius TaxID=79782 RepID=A0A8I6SG14_CIMLE|nr:probable RNA methyltransferase CG11342 isoform X1 [Cimex lectularius]